MTGLATTKDSGYALRARMLPGFNHNLRHRAWTFHVQTEDGGSRDPRVVTQLFLGGRLLAVERWSYAELSATLVPRHLEPMVRARMIEMHKGMLHAVTRGTYDALVSGEDPCTGADDERASEAPTMPLAVVSRASPPTMERPTPAPAPAAEVPPSRAPGADLGPPEPPAPPERTGTPLIEAITIEAPIELVPRAGPPGREPLPPAPSSRLLSDEELLEEIDAELRRRDLAIRTGPSLSEDYRPEPARSVASSHERPPSNRSRPHAVGNQPASSDRLSPHVDRTAEAHVSREGIPGPASRGPPSSPARPLDGGPASARSAARSPGPFDARVPKSGSDPFDFGPRSSPSGRSNIFGERPASSGGRPPRRRPAPAPTEVEPADVVRARLEAAKAEARRAQVAPADAPPPAPGPRSSPSSRTEPVDGQTLEDVLLDYLSER